ncbi:MAG: MarR family transcriptional regulator [Parvularculaceae bacterium]|nr:MarR family transcriptional regulator [Parvularculaceae bacterium]
MWFALLPNHDSSESLLKQGIFLADDRPPSIASFRAAHLIERLGRVVRADGFAFGLNPAQWEALRYLARANRFSRTPAALADYFNVSRGTVSQTLIALEEKGLVEKSRSARDARVVDLALTADGRRMLTNDAERALAAAIDEGGSAGEIAALLASALSRALARRGGKAFGVCKTCRHFRREGTSLACALLNTPLTAQDAEAICAEMEAA